MAAAMAGSRGTKAKVTARETGGSLRIATPSRDRPCGTALRRRRLAEVDWGER